MDLRRTNLNFALLGLVLISSILACSFSSEVSEEEKQAALNVVEWNLYYLATENVQGAMNTIHDDAPGRDEMWSLTQELIQNLDFEYTLLEAEVISIDSTTARVRVVQQTRKIGGSLPFRDNQMEAIHTLRKSADGEWKIYETDIVGEPIFLD